MAPSTARTSYQVITKDGIPSGKAWETGFWRRAPVSGVLALITALLCGAATIAILEVSNGIPIDSWHVAGYNVQPTVLLAIFASLANALLRYAFFESVRISWWVRAQKGSSIGGLHRFWDHAHNAMALVTSGRHLTSVAVTSFLVGLLLLDGPFLQRASHVGQRTTQVLQNLTVPVSSSPFMSGATGIYSNNEATPSLLNPLFSQVLQEYNKRKPITLHEFGCEGRCDFELIAPGFDIACNNWISPYRLASSHNYKQWENNNETNYNGPAFTQEMFRVNVSYSVQANDLWETLHAYRTGSHIKQISTYPDGPLPWNTILLSSMIKNTTGIGGTLAWRSCALREAVQKYQVTVDKTTLTLHPRDLEKNVTMYLVGRESEAGNTEVWPSTVGGLWLSIARTFQGKAKLATVGPFFSLETESASALAYLDISNWEALNTAGTKWTDPIGDMISMIQELSLRTAIATTYRAPMAGFDDSPHNNLKALTATQPDILSPNLMLVNRTLSQKVEASVGISQNVYQSERSWMAAGLLVIGVVFFGICSTFGAWWRLGRDVSLSPMEIARAFDAPLLRYTDPNAEAREIVDEVGDVKIQYGASGDDSIGGGRALTPCYYDHEPDMLRRRLHFGKKGAITSPHKGETFSRF